MEEEYGMLEGFNKQSKWVLAFFVGVFLIIIAVAGYWVLNKEYQPLFVDLEPKDSALIMQQLDSLKVDYRVSDVTGNIEVPSTEVHNVRLQLMATDVAINGGVGYEIFDNSDFGMTEFAQKINFQRALEGEIQRTIASLNQVKQARVHLVLPERSLFRENNEQPSASITLIIKQGMSLNESQILGIQKLAASSVQGLKESQVTINDQNGLVLTQQLPANSAAKAIPWQLKQKKEVEEYLNHKVSRVLEHAFGQGDVVVSVDVVMNFDEVKKRQERVIPLEGGRGISREKESVFGGEKKSKNSNKNVTKEIEYQMGRSFEEIIENPGTIERLNISVLLTKFISDADRTELAALVGTVVGFDPIRGDKIAVYFRDKGVKKAEDSNHVAPIALIEDARVNDAKPVVVQSNNLLLNNGAVDILGHHIELNNIMYAVAGLLIFLVLLLVFMMFSLKQKNSVQKLGSEDREKVLMQLQHWLVESNE